jgi:hypothetical protein
MSIRVREFRIRNRTTVRSIAPAGVESFIANAIAVLRVPRGVAQHQLEVESALSFLEDEPERARRADEEGSEKIIADAKERAMNEHDVTRPARRHLILAAAASACSMELTGCVVDSPPKEVVVAEPPRPHFLTATEVQIQPPVPREEILGVSPGVGYVWAPGYWGWEGGAHVWVAGHWLPPRAGYYWEPHVWAHTGYGWHLREGYWARR